MPNHYVDRGIIKWAPFDALVGYGAMIRELKIRLNQQNKPLLSDDQYDELNRKFALAFQQNLEISITYFEDGFMRNTWGKIRKIDRINQIIILTPLERIRAANIIEINF